MCGVPAIAVSMIAAEETAIAAVEGVMCVCVCFCVCDGVCVCVRHMIAAEETTTAAVEGVVRVGKRHTCIYCRSVWQKGS